MIIQYLCELINNVNIMDQKITRPGQLFAFFVLLAVLTGFSSCEKYTYTPPAVDPNATWSLATDIQPIFTASCASCHGGAVPPDLREGKSFQALTKGGYVDTPAESSRLYAVMIGSSHTPRSTEAEKLKVLYWITQGAENN
jgi:hypothetical protein